MKLVTSLLLCAALVVGAHAKCLPNGDAKNVPSLMSFCGASRGSGVGVDEGNVWVVTSLRGLDYYDDIAKERYEKHTGPGGILNGKSDDCKRYYKSVQCLSVLGACTLQPGTTLTQWDKMCQSNCDDFAKWCGDTSLKPLDVDLTCSQKPWSASMGSSANDLCPLRAFAPSATPTASTTATTTPVPSQAPISVPFHFSCPSTLAETVKVTP